MTKNQISTTCAQISFFLVTLVASLDVLADSTLSTTLTATSDYIADGVSQSDSKPVLQMGIDYEHDSGLYVGIWGSRIDNDSPATPNMELDYAVGFTKDYSDSLSYDLGVTQYTYHHVDDKTTTDYHEWYLGLTLLKNTSAYYYYADDKDVWDGTQRRYILKHAQPINDNLSVVLTAERLSYEKSIRDDYNTYQIGINKNWMDADITLSYWTNTIKNGDDTTDARVVLEISKKIDLITFKK